MARFSVIITRYPACIIPNLLSGELLPAAKHIFVRVLHPLIRKKIVSPDRVDPSRIRRILVIRQHDMLGDFLLATPVFHALRSRFPSAVIGALVRDYFASMVLHNPDVDEILVVKKAGNQWDAKSIGTLFRKTRRRWDLAIVLNTVSHSLTSDILAWLSGARYVLGSEYPPFADGSVSPLYNLVAPYADGPRHQTERNLDIVRFIGADTPVRGEALHLLDAERIAAGGMLQRLGLQREGPVIGMHIGAGKPGNRWPVEAYARLANLLHRSVSCEIVLFWGPGEESLAAEFRRNVKNPLVAVPPVQLRELAACFTKCDLLVCNDTGVMHVAAAAGVPLAAVFGPTDPAEWKPLGDRFVALRADDRRTASVTVEQVYQAVRQLLA